MSVAHFGTFDVANYGDLLLARVLEHRLAPLGIPVRHVSPRGGAAIWRDSVATISIADVLSAPEKHTVAMVGGGNLIHGMPAGVAAYQASVETALVSYSWLWLGAARLAAVQGIPLCWNAPGVPAAFGEHAANALRQATCAVQYLAVRDATSRDHLRTAGVARAIAVVPDTAFDVARLWSTAELERAYRDAHRRRGAEPPTRSVVLHLSPRYCQPAAADLAAGIQALCRRHCVRPILLALGPCHGDDRWTREVGELVGDALIVDEPDSLLEMASCIAGSQAYIGSSLHGMITACAFGRRGMLVVSDRAARRSKFLGLAAPLQLEDWLVTTWSAAFEKSDALMSAGSETWACNLRDVEIRLAAHWDRLCCVLRQASRGAGGNESVPSSPTTPTIRRRLTTEAMLADPAFRPLLIDQAGQTMRLRQRNAVLLGRAAAAKQSVDEADRARRKAERQDGAHRAQLEAARLALDAERERVATLRDECAALDDAVTALLQTRRWRMGAAMGDLSQRLRGRPRFLPALHEIERIRTSLRESLAEPQEVGRNANRHAGADAARHQLANPGASASAEVDVVVCVHNALSDVKRCLQSVMERTHRPFRLIVVDDGSGPSCRAYLSEFARQHRDVVLLRNLHPRGFSRAANRGLRYSEADYVTLLNSDTIVPQDWLGRLLACVQSAPQLGMVGPLSNAASWQSVPERFDERGDWMVNSLPAGWRVDDMAEVVQQVSGHGYPRVQLLNGFCLLIKRAVIETIGVLDERRFAEGYGSENDYCLRAVQAGFELAVCDDAYVFHAKSRSYSHDIRRRLSAAAHRALLEKHGAPRVQQATDELRAQPVLTALREQLADHLSVPPPANRAPKLSAPGILFLLPVSGGGGGAHSVVLEAAELRRLGVRATIAVPRKHRARYLQQYPALAKLPELFLFYNDRAELTAAAQRHQLAVATIYRSIYLLEELLPACTELKVAYYVQDYEPWFFPPGSSERRRAVASYTLLPDATLFAKTGWLCDIVRRQTGAVVRKVEPSLDTAVYYPTLVSSQVDATPVKIAAMVRPATPRRGARRTLEVMRSVNRTAAENAELRIFGCSHDELAAYALAPDFPVHNHGILRREQVADLLRRTHIFVDLSDYQAFGRTGLEAMACGCSVILPAKGGCTEYARHCHNALLVDTAEPRTCVDAILQLVTDHGWREQLRANGLQAANEFSLRKAALSEWNVFAEVLGTRHQNLKAEDCAA